MSQTILVTGATGTVGSRVLRALQERGATVIAAVRNADAGSLPHLHDVQRRVFDYADATTFASALEDIDGVFLLGPPLVPTLYDLLEPFIDAIGSSRTRRVVYMAALGLEKLPSMPFHEQAIARIREHGLDLTVMKPTFFAQNFRNYEGENVLERGIIFHPADDGKAAFVDVDDIAEAVAAVFSDPATIGQEYHITGPTSHSYAEVATMLTDVLGRPITYVRPDPQAYRDVLASAGAPPFVAEYMIDVYGLIRDGHVDIVTDHVQKLTGRPATPLRNVLERQFA
jgi:uncharacterized protein YbjT (DUF2867 family)